MPPTADVRRKRESIVREHKDSENRHEFDATLATFDHPRYELIATGDVFFVFESAASSAASRRLVELPGPEPGNSTDLYLSRRERRLSLRTRPSVCSSGQ